MKYQKKLTHLTNVISRDHLSDSLLLQHDNKPFNAALEHNAVHIRICGLPRDSSNINEKRIIRVYKVELII